jgi:hypothetical protein
MADDELKNNKSLQYFVHNHWKYRNPQGETKFIKTVISYLTKQHKITIIDGGYNKCEWTNDIIKYANGQMILSNMRHLLTYLHMNYQETHI